MQDGWFRQIHNWRGSVTPYLFLHLGFYIACLSSIITYHCRSRKHRIVSSAALSGTTVAAFNDVSIKDPDFEHIQCKVWSPSSPCALLSGFYYG